MADLDPATLEKFQKFQAMLAASPEIVEALNSPELLALAAKAAGKKNAEPVYQPEPVPEYPVVGYGVSDEVSVMSEMTTPTVMTRQTVEEDEFYPEVDVSGKSSSGIHGGPRRIGLKIGVSGFKDGDLPPPPPKSKSKGRHHRSTTRKIKPIAPMSKIAETDGSETTGSESPESKSKEFKPKEFKSNEYDTKGELPASSKKSTWKPITVSPVLNEKKERHPFLATSGAGTARRTARHSSYNQRTSRRASQTRGINRNRSMPVNLIPNSSGGDSSESLQEEDYNTKKSSEINSTPSVSDENLKSKSLSPTQSSDNIETITETEAPSKSSAPSKRGVVRNRSMPMTPKQSYGSESSGSFLDDNDDTTKISGASTTEEKLIPENSNDGKNVFLGKKSRGKSIPRMRIVPVVPSANKSIGSAETSPAKLTRSDQTKSRSRSRSLSKKIYPYFETDAKSVSSEQKKISAQDDKNSNPISDNDSQGISTESSNSKSELSDSSSSEHRPSSIEKSNQRPSVTRRWKPPSIDESAIPPAFRSSSNHSQNLKLSGSTHSVQSSISTKSRGATNDSKTGEPKESRSEEQTDVISDDDDEEDYVRQIVRKPAKVVSRPNPARYKQSLSEITQVMQGDTSRPDDYLPGSGTPLTVTRRKKTTHTKKSYSQPSELGETRSEDWLGSGKVPKRSWKAKKPLQC